MGIFQPMMSVFRRFSSSTVRKSACHESDFVVVTLGPSRGSRTGRFEGKTSEIFRGELQHSKFSMGPKRPMCIHIYIYKQT